MAWSPWRHKNEKFHGLQNQGSTCFLNSVLQVLFRTEDFRNTVHRYKAKDHIDRELKELFTKLEKSIAQTHKITKRLKIYNVHEQRDAAEHYEKILRLTSPEASQIFHGKLTDWNTCKKCQAKSQSEAGFWSLPLPLVSPNNHYSVEKGLADFFCPSEISGDDQMYCKNCDEKCDAVLHCEISLQPDVLVLLLKRFEFDYGYGTFVKINQPVEVPDTVQIPRQQNLQSQSYHLYAFVEHFGELRYGHYTSTIWSQEDDKWYLFDDSYVAPLETPPKLERSQSAYLLFYRKAENEEMPCRAPPPKRSHEESEEKPIEVKKPKQEEEPMEEAGQKSPDDQESGDENQEYKGDNGKSDQSPNKNESEAFCTEDIRNSNSESPVNAEGEEDSGSEQVHAGGNDGTDLRNDKALATEEQEGQEERQDNYSENQGDVGETGGQNSCEGNGGCPDVDKGAVNVGQWENERKMNGDDSQVANVIQTMQNSESCKMCIEVSDHSGIDDRSEKKSQPSGFSSYQQNKSEGSGQPEYNAFSSEDAKSASSETLLKAENGKDGRGEHGLTKEVQSDQEGGIQNQGDVGETGDQNSCEGNGGCPDVDKGAVNVGQWGSSRKAALSGTGRCPEEESAKTNGDDSQVENVIQTMQRSECCIIDIEFSDCSVIDDRSEMKLQSSGFSSYQQNKSEGSDQPEYNAFWSEDAKSPKSEPDLPKEVQSDQESRGEDCTGHSVVSVESSVTEDQPELSINQHNDQPDIRKGHEPAVNNRKEQVSQEKPTELDNPDRSKQDGFICSDICADLEESNDGFLTKGDIGNASRDCAGALGTNSDNREHVEETYSGNHDKKMDTEQLKIMGGVNSIAGSSRYANLTLVENGKLTRYELYRQSIEKGPTSDSYKSQSKTEEREGFEQSDKESEQRDQTEALVNRLGTVFKSIIKITKRDEEIIIYPLNKRQNADAEALSEGVDGLALSKEEEEAEERP